MKYILEENIKYILSERFILNEDASTIVAELESLNKLLSNYAESNTESKESSTDTKNIATIKQELSALNNTINNKSNSIFQKAINKLADQTLRSTDIARIKGTTKEVIQKVESLLDTTSVANKDTGVDGATVKDYLRQIKILAASDDISKETVLKIKENVAKITDIVNKLAQKKNDDSNVSKYLVTIAEDALIDAHNLKQFIPKVGGADKFATLANADKIMEVVTTIVSDFNAGKSLSEQRQNILNFSNLTRKIIDASGITLDTDRTNTINWGDRFAKAKDKDSF